MDAASTSAVHFLRPQILERRARLEAAATSVPTGYLNDLLAEIDAALERIDTGTYGICETCQDPIEADRLQANPMTRFCLDHLSEVERRAHEQDLELAMKIQARLLPPNKVSLGELEAHYEYKPAGPVGGDYCELTVVGDDRSLFFAVGDIAGKGVAASLLMTHLTAILRSLLTLHLPITQMMSRANRMLCESTSAPNYATLVCGRATSKGVELCNAGHCPPLLLRENGVQRLDSAGLPLGLFSGIEYPLTHANLAAGDSLVLYSDGITEAHDVHGDLFGEDRLTDSLLRESGADAETLARSVLRDVAGFRSGRGPTDDLTLLVVRRKR